MTDKLLRPYRWPLLLLLCIASLLAVLTFGPANISPTALFSCLGGQCASAFDEMILWQVRLPRVLTGFVAGAGLAVAGAILQNTTRNPLADPYLFGIVSGAALGATIATLYGTESLSTALPMAAFFGALLAVTHGDVYRSIGA